MITMPEIDDAEKLIQAIESGQASDASDGYPVLPENIGPIYRQLIDLAKWFDSPNQSPRVVTMCGTPGMLLRDIANELRLVAEIKVQR